MPTTRNRWQAESRISARLGAEQTRVSEENAKRGSTIGKTLPNQERRQIQTADRGQETEPEASLTLTDSQDGKDIDINPKSPKRPRLSGSGDRRKDGPKPAPVISNESALQFQVSRATIQSHIATSTTIPQAETDVSSKTQPVVRHAAKSPSSGPGQQTRLENLPILSNLSSQLLSVLAKMSPTEALQLSRDQTSQSAREYHFIRSLFNPIRDLFLTGRPFLSPTSLSLTEPDQVEVLRKANQAMYASSIFTGEIGLKDMDQNFLEVFVPEQSKLLKAQGSIYLELKTQAFITANRTGAAQPLLVIEELFPPDLESKILDRRPGTKSLAPSEQDFLKRMSSRRDILLADVRNKSLDQLPLRYRWEDLSREVSAYLARNFGPTAMPSAESGQSNISRTPPTTTQPQSHLQGEFSIHEPPMPMPDPSHQPTLAAPRHFETAPLLNMDDFVAQAARAAEIAMQGPAAPVEQSKPSKPPTPEPAKHSKVDPQFQHYSPAPTNGTVSKSVPLASGQDDIPHISQTAPTRVLYERARQAVSAKASPKDRKPLTPSQRRPWTPEEESALMTGLDQVKGPHWSQILAMYGPGGTVNESLKDRNQVQLKDKARNLKLFFLKAGIEVPYYLKYVTGDLKTRAPGQAERQERERMQGDDHRTYFDVLKGGMAIATDTNHVEEPVSPEISPIDTEDALEGDPEVVANEDAALNQGARELDFETMIARAVAEASESLQTT